MKGGVLPILGMGACATALLLRPVHAQGVTIGLEGQLPLSCRIEAPTPQVSVGDVSIAGSTVIPFRVRCNAPFTFALVSTNGSLRTASSGPVAAGLRDAIPYQVSVQIPTDSGSLAGTCPSSALREAGPRCAFPDSRDGIAVTGEASLTVSWSREAEPVAGVYTDMLQLVIGSRY